MVHSTVVLLGLLRDEIQRETVPSLVEQSAAFDGLRGKRSFRVVGGFFHLLQWWCIMVSYEGYLIGDPVMTPLHDYLAAYCLDGRIYGHVEPVAEVFFSEDGRGYTWGSWTWETRICFLNSSRYRLKWDDAVHAENTAEYAGAIERLFARAGTD